MNVFFKDHTDKIMTKKLVLPCLFLLLALQVCHFYVPTSFVIFRKNDLCLVGKYSSVRITCGSIRYRPDRRHSWIWSWFNLLLINHYGPAHCLSQHGDTDDQSRRGTEMEITKNKIHRLGYRFSIVFKSIA